MRQSVFRLQNLATLQSYTFVSFQQITLNLITCCCKLNVSLKFHSCHDCDSIIGPCPVPLNLFLEASEFDFTLLHSLIKQLVGRFCFHAVFFKVLDFETPIAADLPYSNVSITEISFNNPIQFTGMIQINVWCKCVI